jgi:putative transposase
MNELNTDMKKILTNISLKSDFRIEFMESDIDHIHFLISYIPNVSISSIVRKLKQESTIEIWKRYGDELKFHFWKERTFWFDGYFVSSVGECSTEKVREYIQNQGL